MGFFTRCALPELPSETRTGPARAFGGTARGRGREGYGGMMVAEVGGRGTEGRGGRGGEPRPSHSPLQRPCLPRTAGCSVTWEGGWRREEVGEAGTAAGAASERAEAARPHRRLRRRPRNTERCRIRAAALFLFSHLPASRDGRLQVALCLSQGRGLPLKSE